MVLRAATRSLANRTQATVAAHATDAGIRQTTRCVYYVGEAFGRTQGDLGGHPTARRETDTKLYYL